MYMDCHTTFDVHVQEMHKKVMEILFFLNRIKDKFEINTRKIAIQFLALSISTYCLPVYGTTNSTLLRTVQKLRNSPAKYVCIYVSHTSSDHGGRSLIVIRPKIWNALLGNMTNSLTLQVFRKRLKAFLMQNNVPVH